MKLGPKISRLPSSLLVVELLNGLDMPLTGLESFWGNQIFHFPMQKLTCAWFQFQVHLHEMLHDQSQVVEMLL